MSAGASAQSFTDAYTLSQTELRGSARFMGMGGAFTALGADISALNQNPAGIGMYRGSDIGLTLGVDINTNESKGDGQEENNNFVRANVNSAGYVGTYLFGDNNTSSFSWGFSYNRLMRFDRDYSGAMGGMETSLSNYVASYTNGADPSDLWMKTPAGVDCYPYSNYSINAPSWMSILFYNAGMINSLPASGDNGVNGESSSYRGLWDLDYSNLHGYSAGYTVHDRGHADEYNITFGGMIMNVLSWGIGVGITDLSFERQYTYDEFIDDANVPANSKDTPYQSTGYIPGRADDAYLMSYQKVTGTGANFKFGVIIKPIQQLRIGLAVHTPTYYSFNTLNYADAELDWTYRWDDGSNESYYRTSQTPYDEFSYKLRTPWKLMAGVAVVLGPKAILSADYEYDAYSDMKQKEEFGYELFDNNYDISRMYKGTSNFRVGLEYRFTPQLSGRLGFNSMATAAGKEFKEANSGDYLQQINVAGLNPSYETHNSTSYITAGLGYRVNGFYFDLAYVHKHQSSELNAFSPFMDYDGLWSKAPTAKLTGNMSQIVATIGYRF